jgi:hypothetical protein
MELNAILGTYSPSLFAMKINTEANIGELNKLSGQDLATFFHEYFHFLQDVTSAFTYTMMWNRYASIIDIVAFLQQSKEKIKVPLVQTEYFLNIHENQIFMDAVLRDESPRFPTAEQNENLKITNITVARHPKFPDLEVNKTAKLVKLDLENENGVAGEYWFGALAILETMTHLIEKKFFGPKTSPTYPYLAAIVLANYKNPIIGSNEENVFVLCDLALQTQFPGLTFLQLLDLFYDVKTPIASEEVYKLGVKFLDRKGAIIEDFLHYKNKVEANVAQIYGHDVFKHNLNWFREIMKVGFQLRTEKPHFMLDIYRQNGLFEEPFNTIFKQLGTPTISNILNQRWFTPPQSLIHLHDQIHTLFLNAFSHLQNVLLVGAKQCPLLGHCLASDIDMPIDKNCDESPWKKIGQEPLCPFTAAWVSFGLKTEMLEFPS